MPTPEYLALGSLVVLVSAAAGRVHEPERSGEVVRMYDNSLRSSENTAQRKRTWEFTTAALTGAEWGALQPVLEGGAAIAASGYALLRTAGTVTVYPMLGEVTHADASGTDIFYSVTFTLHEV